MGQRLQLRPHTISITFEEALHDVKMLAVRPRCLSVRAAASTSTAAAPSKTLALNITKRTLIDSNGGRAVRNVDGEIYEVRKRGVCMLCTSFVAM